jgi:hypothetical protein
MKKSIITLLLLSLALLTDGQVIQPEQISYPKFNLGFGLGIDYGGIGARATILATDKIEFFGAVGYNLLTVGFNAGVEYRILPKSIFCPYVGAMYGYNGVIRVNGMDDYNKSYYGPSFSGGLEIWLKKRPAFFNVELILPIRSQAYHDAITSLKNNPSIVFQSQPLPFSISLGYHIIL